MSSINDQGPQTPLINDPLLGLKDTSLNNTSFFSAVFNIANSITFMCTGVASGVAAVLGVCIFSSIAMVFLIKTADQCGLYSFKEVAVHCFGKKAGVINEIVVFCFCLGMCTAYSVLIGDFIPSISRHFIPDSPLVHRSVAMFGATLLFLFPLSLIKDLNKLRYTSFFAILFVVFSVVAVGIRVKTEGLGRDIDWIVDEDPPTFFIAISLISVSYAAHFNVLPLYRQLKNKSTAKMIGVSWTASLICGVVYATMGAFGFLVFGDDVQGNVLLGERRGVHEHRLHRSRSLDGASNYLGFDDSDMLILCARSGLIFTLVFSYPLMFIPGRKSIELIFFHNSDPSSKGAKFRAFFFTLIGSFAITGIAYLVPGVQHVLAYNGAIFGVAVVFFGPSLFFRKTCTSPKLRAFALLSIILGVFFLILGVTTTTMELINGDD